MGRDDQWGKGSPAAIVGCDHYLPFQRQELEAEQPRPHDGPDYHVTGWRLSLFVMLAGPEVPVLQDLVRLRSWPRVALMT